MNDHIEASHHGSCNMDCRVVFEYPYEIHSKAWMKSVALFTRLIMLIGNFIQINH